MSMNIQDIVGTGEAAKELIKQTGELVKEPVANIVNPSTKTMGQRLGDIVDLIFTPVQVAKIYKDNAVEKFKNKLTEKIEAIPENKRVTPPLNVIGPAVEAAKYYVEEPTLREMFANLITRAMSSDTIQLTHPAFVEIIKQLSPLDATNIAFFKNGNIMAPVVTYVLKAGVTMPLVSNVTLWPSSCKDVYAISASITNLIRLGLLEADFTINAGDYKEFTNEELLNQVTPSNDGAEALKDMISFNRGMLRPTIYGKQFIIACV